MKTKPQPLAGKLTISLPTSSRIEEPMMEIRVQCALSGVEFIEVHVSPGDLMKALTTRFVDCTFTTRALSRIGSKSETKTELVEFNRWASSDKLSKERKGLNSHERSPTIDALLAPFEIDGWRASVSDLFNRHRGQGGNTSGKRYQAVLFDRHVNVETGEPIID